MALLVTPKQLARTSDLYHQLAVMLGAGVDILQALRHLRAGVADARVHVLLGTVLESVEQGTTFVEAFSAMRGRLPEFDFALIAAGEQSGRLDICLHMLSAHYQHQSTLLARLMSGLAYPVMIVHLGVLLAPLPTLILKGDFGAYFLAVLTGLIPVYIVGFALAYALKETHSLRWRTVVEAVVRPIPVLGKARHEIALGRLAAAAEALLNAGVPVIRAWQLAAEACGSPRLLKEIGSWPPHLEQGVMPSELIRKSKLFPSVFQGLYHTAELSGAIDTTLSRLSRMLLEEGARKMEQVAAWLPRMIYGAVALMVAYRVVSFYAGYFSTLREVM